MYSAVILYFVYFIWILRYLALQHLLSLLRRQEWDYEITIGCYYLPLPRHAGRDTPSLREGDYYNSARTSCTS